MQFGRSILPVDLMFGLSRDSLKIDSRTVAWKKQYDCKVRFSSLQSGVGGEGTELSIVFVDFINFLSGIN